jgi:phage repressor protein C with HTH and peptisase S24 domain
MRLTHEPVKPISAIKAQDKATGVVRDTHMERRPNPYIEWIRKGLEKPGKSQSGLARHIGVDPSAINKLVHNKRFLKAHEISKVAEYLEEPIPAPKLGDEKDEQREPVRQRPPSDVRLPDNDRPVQLGMLSGPRDVPVLGITVGGSEGDFQFNGQTIDYAPRPPGLTYKKDVYALYVASDSMAPRYEPGDRIYVDPHRVPSIQDYVVIEMKPAGTEPGPAYLKRLVRRAGGRIIVEQFNPPRDDMEFYVEEIKALHRVIPWNEVNGA